VAITDRPSGIAAVTYKSGPGGLGELGNLAGGYVGSPLQAPPLWTSGEQVDVYGYRDASSYPQMTFDQIYRTQPWVAAVVNKLVRQISRTPLKVYRDGADGNHVRVRMGDNDPGASLDYLLNWPAPRKGAIHLKQWLARPLLVFGNSLIAKYYGDGPEFPPTELVPMDWRYIDAYAQPGGEVEIWRTTQLGSPRFVAWESTVHTAWDADGCIGISPLEQLATSVMIEDAAERLTKASFQNASRPSGGIALPANMTNANEAQMRQMRQDIEAMHRGVDNAFKVALLAPGAQWVPMSFNLQDSAVLDMRQYNREEICAVYDLKPSQVGAIATPGAGYGSVVEVNRDLYRTSLPPWFRLMEETIECQLIRPEPLWEGLHVEFEYAAMLQGDPEAVAAQLATEIAAPARTPNEARDVLNLPRINDPIADQLMFPMNNIAPAVVDGVVQTAARTPETPDMGPAS
jgi:HK97 family phage portal protein